MSTDAAVAAPAPAPAPAAAVTAAAPFAEDWITGPGKISFYTRWYATQDAPKGLIVFAHGFIEHIARSVVSSEKPCLFLNFLHHPNSFEHVFSAWHARGFAVFAYDQRGFGRTALDNEHKSRLSAYGKFSGPEQLDDIEFFIKHAREKVPKGTPFFLYGHSMVSGFSLGRNTTNRRLRDYRLSAPSRTCNVEPSLTHFTPQLAGRSPRPLVLLQHGIC